ncbi:hypothetical protein B9G69_007815 [Bdellovibrio sp. SKB1291214]|uniref:hypothetical protein n=1 Tax=Bdellovibrio sp. SKB1291214 TaxID=1732569 RepID=UPI000B51A6FA|nr:hypothetical protein [Bdellovibrio sp. SKB1291214]UYL10481.1 hypothetical protein B9G69_007815 [Bdellovibrio sp. SKB1291214]
MKQLIIILTALWSLASYAAPSIPELPEDACDSLKCTKVMKSILSGFNNTPHAVSLEPAVYSGGCYHLGDLNPDHEHFAALMIDQLEDGTTYFSSNFAYFYPQNPYANWDLTKGRQEATDYARKNARIKEGSNASRVEMLTSEGAPAVVYYMRQDPQTKTIYYITYGGFGPQSTKIFCTMNKNP